MASRNKTTSVIISTLLSISAVAFNLTASAQPSQEGLRDNAQQERRDNPQSSPNRPSTQNQPQTHNQRPSSSPGNNNQARPQQSHETGRKAAPSRNHTTPAAQQHPSQARHGAGPDDRYRKGDTLPQPYQGRRYYVSQPERYNLPAPGHGQRWVKVGADYVLITIATGLIIDLVIHPR